MQKLDSKILYITAQTPTGWAEAFILTEMVMLKQLGVKLLIVPRNPQKGIYHKEADKVISDSLLTPLINLKIIIKTFCFIIGNIFLAFELVKEIISKSNGFLMSIKNLVVLPKTIYLKHILLRSNISHIHAHWGGTTSTMALILSKLTEIPWSFTLHRWGIKENNMLEEKVISSAFVRCISEHGKNELTDIIGGKYLSKIKVIHMGVNCDVNNRDKERDNKDFVIVVPANLIPVKGHKYLIEALVLLDNQNIGDIKCYFYGDGESRKPLESLIESKHLKDVVEMPGKITHEGLIALYANRSVDVVILPSINTKAGAHEGIPVSLMEAMAYGVPVISTNTGGIPELLAGGSGIMVEDKNPQQLADAIFEIKNNNTLHVELSESGRKKVNKEFNLKYNTAALLEYLQK